jgi:hypothetical protein
LAKNQNYRPEKLGSFSRIEVFQMWRNANKSLKIFVTLGLVFFSAESLAWDVAPLEITRVEGGSAVVEITIDQFDWVFEPSNCNLGQWGVEFTGFFVDGTAIWGDDLDKDFPGDAITGVCTSNDPTGDSETILSLTVSFIDEFLVEDTEQATIEFEYCPPSLPLKESTVSQLEATCIQRIVNLTVEDSDLDVFIDTFTADPTSIFESQSTTLSWFVVNAVGCEASGGGGGWAGTTISLPQGNKTITLDEAGSYEFVLTCTGAVPGEGESEVDIEPRVVTDSVTVTVEIDDIPDLDVVRVTPSSSSLVAGEGFSIEASVQNEGRGPSTSTRVRFLLSADNFITPSDQLLAESVVPALEVDEIAIATAQATAPLEPGGYYVGACVNNLPQELQYGNNCSRGTQITVGGDSCRTGELACGQAVSGGISSLDCDSGPLGEGYYAKPLQLSGQEGETVWFDAAWSFDGYLLLEGPGGLVVAENDNFTSNFDSQIEHTFTDSGTYILWLSSYSPNDGGDFDVSMDCDRSGGPDLVGEILGEGVLSTNPAGPVSLSSLLANTGSAPADSSTLRWLLSSDPEISPTDTQLASMTVASLAAGDDSLEEMEFLAPQTPGSYWLGTCVDSVPAETATTNNCSNSRQLNVAKPPSCFTSSLSCGGAVSSSLNAQDCTSSPRGAGYFAEKYTISATGGEPLSLRSDWAGVDGFLYLLDPAGNIVAQNDDNLDTRDPQSLIEYVPGQSGTYSVWATTYAPNESGNFGLSANCGASSAPDLVTTSRLVDDSAVSVGDSVLINYTITNVGNAPADPTIVVMCLSNDPVISLRDSPLDSNEISELAAGASITLDMQVTVPDEPGDYWVGPCALPVDGEAVTGNNCTLPESGTQSLEASNTGRSKLQASGDGGLLLNVSSGAACSSLPISCGQSQSGSLQSTDCDTGPRGTGYVSDAYTFNGSAGDTVTLDVSWSGVDGYLYLESPSGGVLGANDDFGDEAGSRIEVVLDQSGSFTVWPTAFDQGDGGNYELNLACNQLSSADLEVDQQVLSSTSLRPGQSISVSTQVRNKGSVSSQPSVIDYIISESQDLAGDNRVLKSSDVPSLAAGGSSADSVIVEIDVIPGSYYVGSCIRAEADELDTDNNCKVSGPITIEQTNQPIAFNTGLNDAWYDPNTDGQGFFINVFPDDNLVFLSWFTFDTERPPGSVPYQLGDPGHRWLTAQGRHNQGVAELEVSLTVGGVFDSPQPAPLPPSAYGNMTVSFSDCNNGTIDFDLPSVGESGIISVTRVVNDNVADCEELLGGLGSDADEESDSDSPFVYNRSLNDAWYNPATDGQGFFFNVFPGLEFVFLSWFTYDVQRPPEETPFNLGEPGHRWLTAQGPFNGDTASLVVSSTAGGVFNQGSLPPENTTQAGSMTATFENCNSGVVNYSLDSIGRQGQVPIQRVVTDSIPDCEQQSKGGGGGRAESISPEKDTLENLCGGSVDWSFEWPEVENASFYIFELYRNDSLQGSPRVTASPASNKFDYSGKEEQIESQYTDNWRWRYRPILGFGKKGRVRWSEFFEFNVKSPDDPCLD